MFFFPTFSSILHLGLIDIHPCACFFLVCPSVNSGGIGSGGGERITAMEFTSKVIPSALWVFNTTTTTTKCSGADNSLRLPILFVGVCGNFSQRVKCKADQISHFCLLVDIKERPRMCKTKKGEKRKQSVKQRGGARRNTKTQTQKLRKAKVKSIVAKCLSFKRLLQSNIWYSYICSEAPNPTRIFKITCKRVF